MGIVLVEVDPIKDAIDDEVIQKVINGLIMNIEILAGEIDDLKTELIKPIPAIDETAEAIKKDNAAKKGKRGRYV